MLKVDIRYLKGVGPAKAAKLNKLNIFTVEDLLNYFPVKYEDRRYVSKINEIGEEKKYLLRVRLGRKA